MVKISTHFLLVIFIVFGFIACPVTEELPEDPGTSDAGETEQPLFSDLQEDWTRLEEALTTFLTCGINESYERTTILEYVIEPERRIRDRDAAMAQQIGHFKDLINAARLSPHVKIHKLYLEKCIDSLSTAAGIECLFEPIYIENCRLAIHGDALDDEECLFDEECAEQSYCLLDDQSCPTVCKKYREANESCAPGESCADGFRCDESSLFCVEIEAPQSYPKEGDACIVNLGVDACGVNQTSLACLQNENQEFTCQKIKIASIDEECNTNQESNPVSICANGYTLTTCYNPSNEGTLGVCRNRPNLGESCYLLQTCNPDNSECVYDEPTDTATCTGLIQEGASCVNQQVTARHCDWNKDLYCKARAGDEFGLCRKNQSETAMCMDN